jgi:aminoglycoside/choline kinase family phosphotransferase
MQRIGQGTAPRMVRIGRTVETIGITFFTLKYWAWFGRRTRHPKKQKKNPRSIAFLPHFTAHPILINVSDWFNTHAPALAAPFGA